MTTTPEGHRFTYDVIGWTCSGCNWAKRHGTAALAEAEHAAHHMVTDTRLKQAANLVSEVLIAMTTDAQGIDQSALHEARYRLGMAHDALAQADRLLAGQPA